MSVWNYVVGQTFTIQNEAGEDVIVTHYNVLRNERIVAATNSQEVAEEIVAAMNKEVVDASVGDGSPEVSNVSAQADSANEAQTV